MTKPVAPEAQETRRQQFERLREDFAARYDKLEERSIARAAFMEGWNRASSYPTADPFVEPGMMFLVCIEGIVYLIFLKHNWGGA